MTTILMVLGLLATVFLVGASIAATLGLSGVAIGLVYSDRPFWDVLGFVAWNTSSSATLAALPLFVMMGELLVRSGITARMYHALSAWLNPLPGGLLHTNIAASALFASMSGSSVATAATISGVAMPTLRKLNYDESWSTGSLAAGGGLGILIPPSVTFIVYAVLVQESIGKLYIAALGPAVLMIVLFMALILVAAIRHPSIAPRTGAVPLRARIKLLRSLVPIVVLLGLVVGTIYFGVATASEAAAFGTTGALLLAIATGNLSLTILRETFLATVSTTAMILFILIGAFVLQFVLSFLGIPSLISRWIISMEFTPFEVVVAVCIMFLVLGTFMEELSVLVTTVPVLAPILQNMGVDMVWFGVLIVILVQIGLISPPVGMNLFVIQEMRNRIGGPVRSITDLFYGVIPFVFVMIITLMLIVLFPEISLYLVEISSTK